MTGTCMHHIQKIRTRVVRMTVILLLGCGTPFLNGCSTPSPIATMQPTPPPSTGQKTNPLPVMTPSVIRPASPSPVQTSIQASPPVKVVVTRDNQMLPAGCSPEQVAHLIINFFDTVNEGNVDHIPQFFLLPDHQSAASPQAWYSVSEHSVDGQARGFAAYTQSDLRTYFVQRHQQQERLQLLMVDIGGPSWHGGVDIAYVVSRAAKDLPPALDGSERLSSGKGAINCQQQKIFVWSMGMSEPDEVVRLDCPQPPDWKLKNSIIACARTP